MKKLLALLVVSSCCVAMGASEDDIDKVSPVAIKSVNFKRSGESITVITKMVFENKLDKTVLMKDVYFLMDLRAEKNGSVIEIPRFSEGTLANDAKNPMILPPGYSIHAIETVFAKSTDDALKRMVDTLNVFGDKEYKIVLTMSGEADTGKYKDNVPSKGSIFSSRLEFVGLTMTTVDVDSKYDTGLGKVLFAVESGGGD